MAVVTRYYGAAAAGSDDGTSWANRKAFVVTGAINTQISAFDFTSDTLIARIGPGTHTLTTTITTFTGATGPSQTFPCILEGCLDGGARWQPPDPDWCSDMFNHALSVDLALLEMVWNEGYTFDSIDFPEDHAFFVEKFGPAFEQIYIDKPPKNEEEPFDDKSILLRKIRLIGFPKGLFD